MLHNHIVKHKLLAPVMALFEEVRTANNLTNSALLDLFRIIRAVRQQPIGLRRVATLEGARALTGAVFGSRALGRPTQIPTGRELVAYLVSEHRPVLEQSADDLAPCRQLIVRYEQFADGGPSSSDVQSDQAERYGAASRTFSAWPAHQRTCLDESSRSRKWAWPG